MTKKQDEYRSQIPAESIRRLPCPQRRMNSIGYDYKNQ